MKRVYAGGMAVLLSTAISMNSLAAGWYQEGTNWKYQKVDNQNVKGGWQWLDGNQDGIMECYYFDANGNMLANTVTPDGYQVDKDGAWVVNGAKLVKETGILSVKWEYKDLKWKFQKPDGGYTFNGWYWIDGNKDGIAECYCFDVTGQLIVNGKTPDGYTVNADGAWVENGQTVRKYSDGSGSVPASGNGTGYQRSRGGGSSSSDSDSDSGNDSRPSTPDQPSKPDKPSTPDQPDTPDVTESSVTLYSAEQGAAPVLMDTAYADSENDSHASRTHTQIARAVNDLRQDIAMVNGSISYEDVQQIFNDDEEKLAARLAATGEQAVPPMIYDQIAEGETYKNAIIVGAIGDSPIIDKLIQDGKLDEAKDIEGKWEGYVIKNVENPVPGVANALVIAGSDARGTIYGIYTVSEEIGVSPFYWYSDVPVDVKDTIEVDYSEAVVNEGPKVKYRGIFINDEDMSIRNWAPKKFTTENGTPDINYYRKVFELMLRLKCNLLWPAMHELSTSFAAARDENGIPVNSKEAAKYGVVIGSSHCEILLRSNTGEWWDWYNKNKNNFDWDPQAQSYDFSANREALLQYWRERLETNKDFESVLTLGIRGIHDGGFNCYYKNQKYGGSDVKFMEDVIKAQRELIAEVYFDGDKSRLSEIPQVLIPYKEMGTVYNAGLKDFMAQPEYSDITLMWAEDNHGYLRQTPNETEKERPGGAGVYYHASYWGSPTSYLWLNSIPLSLLSEQLHRAYDEDMKNQWVLNVGDIKPGDQSMEFYSKFAWDPESYDDTNVEDYLKEQAIRDWNVSSNDADTIAAALMKYYKMQGTKKAEYYNRTLFPLSATSNGDEALLWQERSQELVDQLTPIYEAMDEETKTAFYEQIYYHVLSVNDAAKEYAYYWKAVQASEQGRVGSTTVYNGLSKIYRDNILNRVDEYNGLNNNKWTGYMSWKHCTGDENDGHDILKDNEYPSVPSSKHGVGAAAEGQSAAGSGTLRLESSVNEDKRYFDVFAMESAQCQWVAEAPEWIKLSVASGETSTEQRVIVTADWDNMEDSQTGEIKVYNAVDGEKTGEPVATFTVQAEKSDLDPSENNGFVEANGYVAVEAEHYSEMEEGSDGSSWGVIVNSGQHGDTMGCSDLFGVFYRNGCNSDSCSSHKINYS